MNRHRYIGTKRRIVTDEEIRAIRKVDKCSCCDRPFTNADIAREFGLDRSTISHIRNDR